MTAGSAVRVTTAAKINLHLRVGPLAPNGFHPLMSWMCTAGLFDSFELQATTSGGVKMLCQRVDVPTDSSNLIWRAVEAMASAAGREPNIAVSLEKHIPMGGGLGGGSGNAAGTLVGLNRLWNLNWPTGTLSEIGAKLGSDVVFFLYGASNICTGRGECVVPIPRPTAGLAVLAFPKISIPTPAVYKKFDQMHLGTEQQIAEQPDWESWTQMSAVELLKNLVNDLEPSAFALHRELEELLVAMAQLLGRTVRMSGSGSTLFTLFDEPERSEAVAAAAKTTEVLGLRTGVFELAPIAIAVTEIP